MKIVIIDGVLCRECIGSFIDICIKVCYFVFSYLMIEKFIFNWYVEFYGLVSN